MLLLLNGERSDLCLVVDDFTIDSFHVLGSLGECLFLSLRKQIMLDWRGYWREELISTFFEGSQRWIDFVFSVGVGRRSFD